MLTMTKSIWIVAIAGLVTVTGCGAAAPEEESGSTESELSASCVSKLKGKVGTADFKKAVEDCIAEMKADIESGDAGSGGSSGKVDAGGGKGDAGTGAACSLAFRCVDGACSCTAGVNVGASCVGSVTTGASACSVLCRTCK